MDQLAKLLQALEASHLSTIEMNMLLDTAIDESYEVEGHIAVPVSALRNLQDVLSVNARLLSLTGTTLKTLVDILRKASEE